MSNSKSVNTFNYDTSNYTITFTSSSKEITLININNEKEPVYAIWIERKKNK